MKNIGILGSTGSIGQSTLSIVDDYPDLFQVVALSAGQNMQAFFAQIQTYHPKIISVQTEKARAELIAMGITNEILVGQEGACAVAAFADCDAIVSAIVGSQGLAPTFAAIEAGKEVLLANKESMVVSGAWMSKKAQEHGATIRPIDSEHSAIFQSLQGSTIKDVKKIILTASGGPFFFRPEVDFAKVTVEQALNHPNWSMGAKITIDSATMMNKGLEVIEARWLFNLLPSQIDVVVHPQSIVHSIVEFQDGSSLCQMGIPHMRAPIAYAMSYPNRLEGVIAPVNFHEIAELTFAKPDHQRFPAIALAFAALESGPTYPAVLNGANEETVAAFLNKRIAFDDISRINAQAMEAYQEHQFSNLQDYIQADLWGRNFAKEVIEKSVK
ncbi:MAG: 1-deoxy-D-xylulose-5-phosphate reductoisomerase [Deltaproteobacteria bacterium]|nr:1-deoxy-D-xylulose-5-phosphate reductoisomerase [Deltaproteobacteria bacterium]